MLTLIKLRHDARRALVRIHRKRHEVGFGGTKRPHGPARRPQGAEAPLGIEPIEQVEKQRQQIDPGPLDFDAEFEPEPSVAPSHGSIRAYHSVSVSTTRKDKRIDVDPATENPKATKRA